MPKLVLKPKILEFECRYSKCIVPDATQCSMGITGINPFNPHKKPVKYTL